MASWVCAECTAVYAVGAPRCPQCRSTDYSEEGAMPKITAHGGPTVHVGGLAVSATWGDSPDPETAGAVTEPPASTAPAPDDGGASSPGTSSSASSETSEPSTGQSESASRSRARTTASRSKKGRTGGPSAPGTDGGPTDDTSAAE